MADRERPKCIDLFSGAGGFTLGFALAGWDVVGHVEYWDQALKTYELNAPGFGFENSELIGRDITKIPDEQVLAFRKKHGHIHAIIGGPPCQSFSYAGKRQIGDPRDNLFLHFVRFVKLIQPDLFILENVPGMLSKKSPDGEMMIDIIQRAFGDIGYPTEYALLNAANYGVPQYRRRVFVMGSKTKQVGFPLPLNFGKGEGTDRTPRPDLRCQYGKCSVCGKYYASYKFTQSKDKECLFCFEHRKASERGIRGPVPFLKPGWLVIPKSVSVPAKVDEIYQVCRKEKRGSVFGTTELLYTRDAEGHVKWLDAREVRNVADNDRECDAAHEWMLRQQVINPMKEAIEEAT